MPAGFMSYNSMICELLAGVVGRACLGAALLSLNLTLNLNLQWLIVVLALRIAMQVPWSVLLICVHLWIKNRQYLNMNVTWV